MPPDADRPPKGPARSRQLAERGRDLQAQAARRLLRAQDEHVTLKLLAHALQEDRATGGALLAGALAFRLFLWMLPAGLVVAALLGFSTAEDVRHGLGDAGLGGYATATIAQAASQAHEGRWILLAIGLAGLYSTSVDLAKAMWIGTSLAWHLPVSRLRRKPRAAGLAAATLLSAITLTLAVNWLRSVLYPLGIVATVLLAGVYALCGWLVLRVLPRPAHLTGPDLLPGALLIGVGVEGLHVVTVFFLAGRLASSSQLYGALGAAATILLWGYILARVLIGASTLNHLLLRHRDVVRLPVHQPADDGAAPSLRSVRSAHGLLVRLRTDWSHLTADLGHTPGSTARGGGEAGGPGGSGAPVHDFAASDPGDVATLTLWRFEHEDDAEAASRTLADLERQGALRVIDAVVVTWPTGARRPRASQLLTSSTSGALGGSFWGLLLGIIFFAPLLGLAVGSAAGALGGALRETGISEAFIQQARDEVVPGTSALFVLTAEADLDRVREAFVAHGPTLMRTNLTPEQDEALREYFSA